MLCSADVSVTVCVPRHPWAAWFHVGLLGLGSDLIDLGLTGVSQIFTFYVEGIQP